MTPAPARLGRKTAYEHAYNPALLDTFPNAHANDYFIKFNCPEFTSICPVTGQPDFGNLILHYIPDKLCVESKSLKLYLHSFRNHGEFHENCVNTVMKDLARLLQPKYIEVWGEFMPRGGLSIDPYANHGTGRAWQTFARHRLLNHDLAPRRVYNR
jgi:7-cyano-7-deazaguanine reductase